MKKCFCNQIGRADTTQQILLVKGHRRRLSKTESLHHIERGMGKVQEDLPLSDERNASERVAAGVDGGDDSLRCAGPVSSRGSR